MTLAISSGRPAALVDEMLCFDRRPASETATVEIVIPVHNEDATLETSITRLHRYLTEEFPLSWMITIADNASTDGTWPTARRLAGSLSGTRAVHLPRKGRGRALRAVWSISQSPVVAYMDVDLSTDLAALLPLVAPLVSGHSDLAIGTRLAPTAQVARGAKREAISRAYNLILRATLRAGFSDAQCGFKAARTDVVRDLLPLVQDDGWFFDTELLVVAEHNGLRIHEVPVDWIDDPDSRVDVAATARTDLAGVWRMAISFVRGGGRISGGTAADGDALDRPLSEQLVRFASIGVVSTAVFSLLVWLLAPALGVVGAAVLSLGACTVVNNAANRRLTFSLRGRRHRLRHVRRGIVVGLVPLAAVLVTLGALAALGGASLSMTLLGLTIVNALAGVLRFGLLERWVFAR
jgi:putative flippase GtrA